MADEQTPQSDLVDDAIRAAERQLEAKLEALRMSALGEPSPPTDIPDDVAVLRPTGADVSRSAPPTEASQSDDAGDAPADEPRVFDPFGNVDAPAPSSTWTEADGDDLTFVPAPAATNSAATNEMLYVPDEADSAALEAPLDPALWGAARDEHASAPESESGVDGDDLAHATSTNAAANDTAAVHDVDDDDPFDALELDDDDVAPPSLQAATDETPRDTVSGLTATWDTNDTPEPVHAEWTDARRSSRREADRMLRAVADDDTQTFRTQTREALHDIRRVNAELPAQVSHNVGEHVARIVRDEVAPTDAGIRQMSQHLQQELPKLADRLEAAIAQAVVTPTNSTRQLRDELPGELDRVTREQREAIRTAIDSAVSTLHAAIQQDVASLEQSIATNVTRLTHGTNESSQRLADDVSELRERLDRMERQSASELERVETQLRSNIDKAERAMRDELIEPTELVRKLDDELPARFTRIERTLLDQLHESHRDMHGMLTSIVDAQRSASDRMAALSSTVDEDRGRRSDDTELIVDTVTTGWEGIANAVTALFDQHESSARRIAAIEQRLGQLRDLEASVETALAKLDDTAAGRGPVLVTVTQPDGSTRTVDLATLSDAGSKS